MGARRQPLRPSAAQVGAVLVRLAVGAVGVAALFVGLRAAWNANSASAALVVGAVLVVVAVVLTPNLAELSWRYKDLSFTFRRFVDKLQDVSASNDEEVPENAEGELMALRERIRAIAAEAAGAADRHVDSWERMARGAWLGYVRGAEQQGSFLRTLDPAVNYTYLRGDEHLGERLAASSRWLGDWQLFCSVRTPSGGTFSRLMAGSPGGGGMNYTFHYPMSFEGAPPLELGEYEFTWMRPDRDPTTGEWGPGPAVARDYVRVTDELRAQQAGQPEVRREMPTPAGPGL